MQDVLDTFHPLIGGWFRDRFGSPTEPQRIGWPKIAAGEDVLIAAPTGSGKTLAAFLACLDALVRRGLADGRLDEHTAILYVSPLKALSNDVQRNLEAPLHELTARAAKDGVKLPAIRVAVRTGDTPMSERERLAKHPPHILVTTPESLFILLTTVRGRAALSRLHTVIVDEIHAIAGDKRGAHLALSLERLDRLVAASAGKPPIRVGLSATQRPIEQIARLLVGMRRPLPHIVDAGHRRELDLAIEITDDELGAVATNEQFARVFDRIAELVAQHRSTIVFVNTRRLVERTAAALEQRLGEEHVVAHHGSMSRALRLAAEQKLKHGRVKAAVATASLELGIDVGTVDLVVQLGSPRSIATLIQRVGRSGHTLGATPKGRMFALTRDQLMECAALVRGVRRGNLDAITVRDAPLDILAQQMVAACAAEDIPEAELVAMMRGATPYANISDERVEQLLVMLAEGVSDRRGRAGAYLHRDRIGGMLKARRGARLAAITSGGAIPDNNNYTVVQWPDETPVGTVDEDFAIDSSPGDIFQLGNTSWKIRRIEMARVLVEDARGQPPTIPFWFGEAPARTRELSDEVSDLRRELDVRISAGDDPDAIAAWLASETGMPLRAAQQATAYLTAGRAALGALPRRDLIVAERFFDEGGGMQLVIHAPLGGRINRAWGLALRKKFCVSFDFELQAAATDDGIVISLGQPHSFPLDTVFGFVPSHQTEEVLVQALLDRPMFEIRWRWNVTRSLTVLRRRNGKRVPPHLIKMRAADTLSVVFPQALACGENIVGPRVVPDHPLVFETVRDCLVEAMDSAGLRELLEQLERGEIQVMAKDTVEPSPLSHELINANPYAFLDDAPLEERRTRAVQLRRGLPPDTVEAAGQLDAAAIALATEEVAPTVRDVDELHDALLALWLVPEPLAAAWDPHASDWFAALCASGRATRLVIGGRITNAGGTGSLVANAATPAWCATDRLDRAADASIPESDHVACASDGPGAANASIADIASCATERIGAAADARIPESHHVASYEIERLGAAADARIPEGAHVAWCATERLGAARAVFGEHVAAQPMIATPSWAARPAREEALVKIIGAHLDHRGPVSTRALAAELGIALPDALAALLALEGDGAILRGSFTAADARPARRTVREALAASDDSTTLADVEWCNRRVLARIHRLTLARLRREIEPVSSTVLMRFLARWQRVARGSQLIGSDGLVRVLEQLQGFETAAGAWEREVLPARLHGYDSTWLDQLCLAGQVVWCRLSPRKGKDEAAEPPPTAEEASELLAAIAHVANATPPLEQFPPALRAAIAAGDRAATAVLAAAPRSKCTADVIGHLEHMRERDARVDLAPRAADDPRGSRVSGDPHDLADDPRGSRVSPDADPRGSRASGDPGDLAPHSAFPVVVNETRAHVCAKGELDDNGSPRIRARDFPRGSQPFGMQRLDPEIATMIATTAERRDAAAAAVEATIAAARAADATRLESAVAAVAAIAGKYGVSPVAVVALVSNVIVPPPSRVPRNAPSRSAPLALMLRRDVGWLRAAAAVGTTEQPVLSDVAARVRDHLAAHGASFLADLVATIDANPDQIEDALWELVGAGLATADGFASLRVLVDRKRGEVKSHFDRTETARTALGGMPPVRKWQEAIRRARTRDRERPSHALRSLPTAAGRWSLLPAIVPLAAVPAAALRAVAIAPASERATVGALRSIATSERAAVGAGTALPSIARTARTDGEASTIGREVVVLSAVAPTGAGEVSASTAVERRSRVDSAGDTSTPTSVVAAEPSTIDVEASARQLLQRYGVVFRDLLQRESSLPPWRDLLVALRRLEARGEIRGGRFVTGFVGEQFALPEALDELRAARTAGTTPEVFRVAATDPLNLVGVLTPGPRVAAILGNAVLYVDGHAVASLEAGTLVPREPCPPGGYVDDDLVYHPPPRPVQVIAQAALPL